MFLEEAVLQTPCLSFQKQTGYKALEVGEISALTVAAFWFSPIIRTSGKISLVPANKGTLKKKKMGKMTGVASVEHEICFQYFCTFHSGSTALTGVWDEYGCALYSCICDKFS